MGHMLGIFGNGILLFLALDFDVGLEDIFVTNDELVNEFDEADCRGSLVVIDCKAVLEYLLDNEMSIVAFVIFARILRVSINF